MMVSKLIITRHHNAKEIEIVNAAGTLVLKVGKDCPFELCQKELLSLCGFRFKQIIFENAFQYSDLNQYIISRLDPA
ncbi:hypothetical protein KX453_16945 [Escherichia coli]|nr:hypothetical protein [Escherichia coli]